MPNVGDLIRWSDVLNAIYPVGAIIHSTVLDTEEKVQAQFGGTTWIQHSGYILRGASSGVTDKDATKTAGNDNAIVPYHNHGFSGSWGTTGWVSADHSHSAFGIPGRAGDAGNLDDIAGSNGPQFAGWVQIGWMSGINANHYHGFTPAGSISYAGSSGNTTNANIPNYKSVYIWERTA